MMLGVDDVMSSSDCSGGGGGGCQSGWTMYLEQSSYSNHIHAAAMHNEDEEDLDLSMLSDASSGPSPALFHEEDLDDFHGAYNCAKKIMTRAQTDKQKRIKSSTNPNNSYLDDTASSTLYEHAFINAGAVNPASHHHPSVVDFSSSSSTTQFKDKSVFDQFDSRLSYFQSPPVAKAVPQSQRPHVRKESGKKKMR